jgi:tetratricopeptide (TPR) repeat protein
MRLNVFLARSLSALAFIVSISVWSPAQAPPSIQIFMPDGALPPHEIRFTLTSDDGIVETFFTDSKGRFLITRRDGLRPDNAYTITILSDRLSYDTTTVRFKHYGVYYVPIFLKPLEAAPVKPAGTIDLAELDSKTPKEAREIYDTAMRALKAGQLDEAAQGLKQAITIYPSYFRALNDLGVLFMKLNRLDESAGSFDQAIKLAPRVYYPRLNLAIVRTRQGRYKEAVAMLEKLHKENPGLTGVLVAYADVLMAVDRLDEADTYLKQALTDDKMGRDNEGDVHYKRGLLLNRKKKYEEAIKELGIAAKILPNAPRVHLQLGGALLEMKRYDEAERELLDSYRLGGARMGGAQFLLGQLYFTAKKYESAMRAFEQYLIDVPEAPNRAEVLSVVEKIKAALSQK